MCTKTLGVLRIPCTINTFTRCTNSHFLVHKMSNRLFQMIDFKGVHKVHIKEHQKLVEQAEILLILAVIQYRDQVCTHNQDYTNFPCAQIGLQAIVSD